MGHSEMSLAVAGLDENSLNERTRILASGDWSIIPAGERAAFFFARKQAKTPWNIDRQDIQTLIDYLGEDRALDIVWKSSWCHYMTRNADALQLPLERENAFMEGEIPARNQKKVDRDVRSNR